MIRTMFSVMLGMVVATTVALGFEIFGRWLFPLPAGSLAGDQAAVDIIAIAPVGMLTTVVIGRLAGAFCGAWAAARLSKQCAIRVAIAVGALVMLSCLFDAWLAPHPLWMTLLGVIGPIPLAWGGGRLASRRARADAHA